MAINSINGGLIELTTVRTPFHGIGLRIYIDQSSNIQNGDSDANIILSSDECKNIINQISAHLERIEGNPYVYLSEPIDQFRNSDDFKLYLEVKEKRDLERLEAERLENERLEAERLKKEEEERLESERIEKERIEQELEAERLEAERIENERLEAERIENERIDKIVSERLDKEKNKLEKEIQERLEKERLEKEQSNFNPIIENTEVKKTRNNKNKI